MKKPAAGAKAAPAKHHPAHAAPKAKHPVHPSAKAAKAAKARAAAKKKLAAAAHKPRKWSPDESVALCSARAVAEAIRLLSGPVLSDADVLALYWSTASDPDAGQTLSEALTAAQGFSVQVLAEQIFGRLAVLELPATLSAADVVDNHAVGAIKDPLAREHVPDASQQSPHALIVGLDLPDGEPHAVVVDIDGTWWSWGQPHTAADFPGAVIDEVWVITCGG